MLHKLRLLAGGKKTNDALIRAGGNMAVAGYLILLLKLLQLESRYMRKLPWRIYSNWIFLSFNFWNGKANFGTTEIFQQELLIFCLFCFFPLLNKTSRLNMYSVHLSCRYRLSELGCLENQVHYLSNQVYSSASGKK